MEPLPRKQFASDNYAGICPEAWAAMADANGGHAAGYGDDPWTQRAADLLRDLFETDCEVFFVFNGTAANSLALASMCQSYHSIVCSETAHVETDECGAPEFFSNGTKVLTADGKDGKIDPAAVEWAVRRRTAHSTAAGSIFPSLPAAVSTFVPFEKNSGAPHSSVSTWATSLQTMEW